ncbi:hypothetical protein [Symbiopectobacterium sp. RP]|uniref:hypothetical protein n=1 Tax=Symbiopectobacterium sp. RP TaxID=3248553 RepID=UPI003D2C5AD0
MGTSKKQKKREWLRYRDFVLSPYSVIKVKSLGYNTTLSASGTSSRAGKMRRKVCWRCFFQHSTRQSAE